MPISKESPLSIASLYPHLSPAERIAAEEKLEEYVVLALRIGERLESDLESRDTMARTPKASDSAE